MEAADKLEKESGFKFNTQLKLDNNQKQGNNDCDVETDEESATDEGLVPPLVLTGE